MARKKTTIEDLHDDIVDFNDHNLKKLKEDRKEILLEPSLKAAMRISKHRVAKAENLDLDNLEAKLSLIAKEKQKAEKMIDKASVKEDSLKFKKAKKKKKREKEERIRLMFSGTTNSDDLDDEGEPVTPVVKNSIVKDTTGTILDNNIGKRFSHLYAKQIDDYEYITRIVDDIKQDLETSPSKNMYRTSQVSNLLSALSQKRTLLKDMTDIAKTVSDLELKYAKEERAVKDDGGTDDGLASKIGVSIVRGLYDDVFEENVKKKKKNGKKYRADDDDDEDEEDVNRSSKKEAGDRLAQRLAKNVKFSNYEKNIDIEGEYTICVLADKEDPASDWKFIIIDEDGERRKDWEKERSELIPSKKDTKMRFLLDKMKAKDKTKTYKLILK